MRTNQGVLVITPGSSYKPYCNVCGWNSATNKGNLEDARIAARAHARDCKP